MLKIISIIFGLVPSHVIDKVFSIIIIGNGFALCTKLLYFVVFIVVFTTCSTTFSLGTIKKELALLLNNLLPSSILNLRMRFPTTISFYL